MKRASYSVRFGHTAAVAWLLAASCLAIRAQVFFSEDFASGDGGFTVNTPLTYDGPWVYDSGSGSWRENGQQPENSQPNTSMLNSPPIIVPATGMVRLSFDHRHSFEAAGTANHWDGGQVRVSINGASYVAVPSASFAQNAYNGTVLANSASVLAGQPAFVETSPGYAGGFLTSVAELGTFASGDTISVQFIAGNDTNTRGPNLPNWQIDRVLLSVPEPVWTGPFTALVLCVAGVLWRRRRQ